MFRLDQQIAVIIGGTGGIGEALANGMAEYGARVVIAGRDMKKAEQVSQNIQAKFKQDAEPLKFDITDEDSVAALRDQVVTRFGTIDILINAHGINIKKPATEFTLKEWDAIFDTNVRGTMLTCREFGKVMIERKKGKVINISSVRGARATFWGGNEGYAATKGALDMITRSLASEWAQYKINVNAIAPSTIASQFSERTIQDPVRLKRLIASCPMGRLGQTSDIVGACIFLASPASDYITGQIIYVDGGITAIC
jgi:NAD(P)-dependent dehydrogenase (short-subunit alcohol dehydrogenase family)